MKPISAIGNHMSHPLIQGLGDDYPSDDYGYTSFDPGGGGSDSGGRFWDDYGSGMLTATGGIMKLIDSFMSKSTTPVKNTYTYPGNQGNQNTSNNPPDSQQTQQQSSQTLSATTIIIWSGVGLALIACTALIMAGNKQKKKSRQLQLQ